MNLGRHSIKDKGEILFLSGIFLLPSAFFFSVILIILSGIINSFFYKDGFFKDKWNKPFLAIGILIFISTLIHLSGLYNPYQEYLNSNLSLLGIFNWIPFFWLFWATQPYLESSKQRKKIAIILIAGTFPVLVSGFGQYFFNWTGPIEILNGLIIWYQKPNQGGLTGLFSNQNYTGSWLSLVWPFSIALVLEKSKGFLKKISSISFLIAIGFAIFITFSRNAWLGTIISIPLVLGQASFYWFLSILFVSSLFVTVTISQINKFDLDFRSQSNIGEKFLFQITKVAGTDRFDIFLRALDMSFINPIFGIGGGSFPVLHELIFNSWKAHPHNLILELALSYGYPATIIFISTVTLILFKSSIIIFKGSSGAISQFVFERAWWASIFIFLISQIFDVQYFDGRISIIFWVLLAGLKKIIDGDVSKTIQT